jgi:hypothetical protein
MLSELRRAWRLYQTDSGMDTVAAVLIVVVVAIPVVRAWWEVKQTSSRG